MTNLYLFDHASGNTEDNSNNILVDHKFGDTSGMSIGTMISQLVKLQE